MASTAWLMLCLCVTWKGTVGIFEDVQQDVYDYQDDVDLIIDHILNGPAQHQFYNELAVFSDDHGPRLAGSYDLEEAINWTMATMEAQGFDNVHGEEFVMEKWVRGDAHGAILQPRPLPLDILAIAYSVGTPTEGLTAEVIVVKDFDELDARASEVNGTIVVYNQEWMNYTQSVEYRSDGASRAAKHGALAVLVSSVTSHSIYSLHTGILEYDSSWPEIPAACITVEDAQMLHRLHKRGKRIEVFMNMSCASVGSVTTMNVVAEYTGTTYPDEVVIIGGHIDSWDVGYGPMDDGGGVIMSWQVLLNLQALGLRPKRTIRTVFWSAEEIGIVGGEAYFEAHKSENASISLIMESDTGTFTPNGIGFTGSDSARAIMEDILLLLSAINATSLGPEGSQPDIDQWVSIGVPAGNLWSQNQDYFDYHHSFGDTMTMEDPDVLDLCSIVWTAVTYVVADLNEKLPRLN